MEQTKVDVKVDSSKTYQEFMGFGGTFTEAAAYILLQVSPDKRQEDRELL